MNKIKFVYGFAFLSTMFLVAGCTSKESSEESNSSETVVMQIDDLLNNVEELAGDTVTIEGSCTHICRKSGKKIFLMGSDDAHTIRVESGNGEPFDPECLYSVVQVKGVLVKADHSPEVLQKIEAQEGHGNSVDGCEASKKAGYRFYVIAEEYKIR